MAQVKFALVAIVLALIACNGFGLRCEVNGDCKGKLALCKDSGICVDKVCKCKTTKLDEKPTNCQTAADCPFVCPPPCDKQVCDPATGLCKCLC